MHEQRTYVRL